MLAAPVLARLGRAPSAWLAAPLGCSGAPVTLPGSGVMVTGAVAEALGLAGLLGAGVEGAGVGLAGAVGTGAAVGAAVGLAGLVGAAVGVGAGVVGVGVAPLRAIRKIWLLLGALSNTFTLPSGLTDRWLGLVPVGKIASTFKLEALITLTVPAVRLPT